MYYYEGFSQLSYIETKTAVDILVELSFTIECTNMFAD